MAETPVALRGFKELEIFCSTVQSLAAALVSITCIMNEFSERMRVLYPERSSNGSIHTTI